MKNKVLEVIKKLADKNVDFVICGGVVCVLQGCDRSTLDLDINIELTDKNLRKAINPDFDGHIDINIQQMTPEEKLDFLWMHMEIRNCIKNGRIRKIKEHFIREIKM